ncbi:MAG: adenylate/guanylate cyclase domain-containing protein, partial [Nitrospinales bacterium]
MKCLKCQADNPDGARYCNACGCDLKKVTDTTSNKFNHLQSYTPKFLIEKILANKSAIEGERKQVTVFFADVAGFTSMSEKLDPEQVHWIMDGAFRILMDEIHAYGGTINQFTGDGVMALFGAPVAHEDHAQRACHAALAIRNSLVAYRQEIKRLLGVNFQVRVGLNTGPVVVGSIGDDLRADYTAAGITVNIAARMESTAKPGTVMVSRNTYRRTSAYFKYRSLGMVKIKGKGKPLPVYELVEATARPKSGLDRQIFSKMMGREKELNLLEIHVLKAINGEGSVVNIIGEAGIGKSRLVAELKNREVMNRIALLEGRAIAMGRNLSFHPVIDLLKQWAKIREDDSETAALIKLETAIRRVCPEDLYEVLPFVATLMGMKLSGRYAERVEGIEGEALERLILKNVRDLLIKATELNPLMIVTEDFHWADMSSIELMQSLLRLAETHRVLFVNVFRPGHKKTGDRIIEILKESIPDYYVEIVLKPLDEHLSEIMVNNMLNIQGFQLSVVDQIVERSGGNPFFIEEVVRSLIDVGAVVAKNGAFEVVDKIHSIKIPHTINDVLMARIDRLEERTRNLVKFASVIGRSFFYKILTEVGRTIDDIDNRLSYLKDIQLIRDRQRMEELEYLFKHALAQEAAYESILVQKRKEIHLQVADSIEKVFQEKLHKFYGMLAYHYSKGEDFTKAEEYMIKAGEEALRSSASREAIKYYKEALSLYQNIYGDKADPEKIALLEKNIAIALYNKGDEDALIYFDSVLNRWGLTPPQNKLLVLIKLIFDLLKVIPHLYFPSKKTKKTPNSRDNEIFDLSFKKVQILSLINPKRQFVEVIGLIRESLGFDLRMVEHGYTLLLTGSAFFSYSGLSFAIAISNRFLAYAENGIDKKDLKELLFLNFCKLIHNCSTGNWDCFKDYDEYLLEENLKIGNLWEVTGYIIFHCIVKLEQGDFKAASPLIERLSKIADSYENESARAHTLARKTQFLIQCRKLFEAQKSAEEYISIANKIDSDPLRLTSLGYKAQIQIFLKDLNGAAKSLERLEEHYKKQFLVPPIYAVPYLVARFSFDIELLEDSLRSSNKPDFAKYRQHARKSCKNVLKNSKKYAPLRSAVFRLTGTFYWLINKQNKAVKYWQQAISEGERVGARPDLARTYMEIGKRFLENKSKHKKLNGIRVEA